MQATRVHKNRTQGKCRAVTQCINRNVRHHAGTQQAGVSVPAQLLQSSQVCEQQQCNSTCCKQLPRLRQRL